jgi:hypothetical protein
MILRIVLTAPHGIALWSQSTDETTVLTARHLTNPAKDAGHVFGYSCSTWPATEKLLAAHPKNCCQVSAYRPQVASRWLSHPAPRQPEVRVFGELPTEGVDAFPSFYELGILAPPDTHIPPPLFCEPEISKGL